MAKGIYITFDPYYDVSAYNSFKTAAKNNGIEFEEFLRIRPPYRRYIKLKDKRDLPSFVNYDFATGNDTRWLVSCIKPVQPDEAYRLRRRDGQDISYFNYIMQEPMKNAHKEEYMMVFRGFGFSQIQDVSARLGADIKIYKWGKAKKKGYDIYYCFNPYIKGVVEFKDVLMEYGKEANSGLKKDQTVPKIQGDIEYNLNHYVLIGEKLENKTLKAEFWQNGRIHPLKKSSFI